jgi:hypothetical protein
MNTSGFEMKVQILFRAMVRARANESDLVLSRVIVL